MPPKAPEPSAAELGGLCLAYLAEDPERLAAFMGLVGYSPDGIRKAAGGEALNRGLIDYFAADESLLLAFCANARLKPEQFMRVWARLNPAG